MKKYSVLEMCMYLESYTDKKYTHDDVECGDFADACIFVLEKRNVLKKHAELVERLNELKGMPCRDIGEEKCSELFSQVKSEFDGKKKRPVKKIIALSVAGPLVVGIITVLIFLPNYIKNKTFDNGISGTYYCTNTLVTFPAENEGYSKSGVDEAFLGHSIKISEDGILSGLEILDIYDCQLTYPEKYFNLDDSYILYKPEEEYERVGFYIDDFGIYSVYFSKRGSQISAGKNAQTDRIELYICTNDVNANFAFQLTFEKKAI